MAEFLLTRPPRGRVIAVMVAWNGKAFLEAAVNSVLRELTDKDDLLVVENGSTDGSFEFLRARFPEVAVLRTGENLGGAGGFAAGVRVVLKDGGCRYVWLLDNDIIVEPGALAPLMAVLEKDQRAAAAGSQLCLYDDPGVVQEIGASYSAWHGGLRQYDNGRKRLDPQTPPRRVDYLAACSLLVRVEAFRRWGLFREEFFVFYDDVEWSLRVRGGGGHLWAVPASVVRHCYGGIKATIPWREYYRKRNRCACLRLHPPHYGGFLVLYAYLVFLNYLARFRQWQGDTVLAEIYRMALEDFLAGRFGRREIPPGAGDGELPKVLAEVPVIWIHHGLALGDALAVLDAIASRDGGQICYLSGRSGDEAVLAGRPGVVLGGPPPNGRVAVVGEVYDWRAARFPYVVRYRCGGRWERVPTPMAEYWKTRLKMGVALFLSVVVALPQWLVALRRKWPPPPSP